MLGLINALDIEYVSSQWRLFIDSSKKSFKAVLLRDGNILPGTPLAYSFILTEHYDNLKLLLAEIDYKTHLWIICSDLKIVAILMGIQSGYVKYGCFFL